MLYLICGASESETTYVFILPLNIVFFYNLDELLNVEWVFKHSVKHKDLSGERCYLCKSNSSQMRVSVLLCFSSAAS